MQKRSILVLILVVVLGWFVSGNALAAAEGKININTASIEELEQLKGVGSAYAAKIVEYREQNGPFTAPEDIMNVQGIGDKTFDENKDIIVVEDQK